jgi:hypothetical protein
VSEEDENPPLNEVRFIQYTTNYTTHAYSMHGYGGPKINEYINS